MQRLNFIGKKIVGFLTPLALGGCGIFGGGEKNAAAPLDTAFSRPVSADVRRGPTADRSGLINYDTARPDPTVARRPEAAAPGEPSNPTASGVSSAVNDAVVSPAAATATRVSVAAPVPVPDKNPPRIPTTVPQSLSSAEYLQLGAVVVEVNGEPIFANKVIDTLAPLLSARARELDESRFRSIALTEIREQVNRLISDELEFATAQRNLDANDKNLADLLTQKWREDQVRKAGGSLQLARQAAAAQGLDFDTLVKDEYRVEMRRVYFQKKEVPKIQVTADDMRQYYAKHKDDLFTEREQAQFRVIKIGLAQAGSDEAALAKVNALRDRAVKGEDFANLAGETNDDPYLMRTKGDVTGNGGWIDRGAYAVSAVEDAVWKLGPGQITPVVKDGRAYYLAKVEQKKGGRTKQFDDDETQATIRSAISREQFLVLRDAAKQRLIKDAIITPDPPMYAPAIEMAMQKYPAWSRKTK